MTDKLLIITINLKIIITVVLRLEPRMFALSYIFKSFLNIFICII